MIRNKDDIHEEYEKLNRVSEFKFGITFFIIFLIAGLFLYIRNDLEYAYISYFFSLLVLVITLVEPSTLRFANKSWMRLAHVLALIISPIILGIIYFIFIFPYSIIFRLFSKKLIPKGFDNSSTYWIKRDTKYGFKEQF